MSNGSLLFSLSSDHDFFRNYSFGMRALYKVSKGSVVTIKSSTNTFNGSRGYETFAVALYK